MGWISKFGKKPFPGNPVFLSIFVRAGRSFAGRLISKNVEKTDFDPNAPGVNNGRYFGLPFTPEQARLVLMSVPWDVTTSYREGTAGGPDAILDASLQVDLYDLHNPDGWRQGIGTLLYEALERCLRQQNIINLNACITYPNPKSEAFHRKFGYQTVAHFTRCGYKFGAWKDMIWMEKALCAHPPVPQPVIPFPLLGIDHL